MRRVHCGNASVAVSLKKGGGVIEKCAFDTISHGVRKWSFPKSGALAIVVWTKLVYSGLQNVPRTCGNASVAVSLEKDGGGYRMMHL